MGNRYSIYPVSFTHAGGDLDLSQIRSQGLQRGANLNSLRPGGALDAGAHILSAANPVGRFSTRDLATALGTISLTAGLHCSGGHEMRWQKRTEGGAFETGSVHMVQTTPKGFLNPVSIDVDGDSNQGAEMALEYTALATSGASPITTSVSQSIALDPAPLFNSVFYLGAAYLGAGQLTGLARVRIAPGIRFVANREDGGAFPKSACSYIGSRDPRIDLTFSKIDMISGDIGAFFANTFVNLHVYLQKGASGDTGRVAAATTSHIKITAAAGTWGAEDISVADEGDGLVTVSIMPTGTLSLSTASAIP